MRLTGLLIVIALASAAYGQERYAIAFGGQSIDIRIARRTAEGFAKTITINSTTPITVAFMKNDKTGLNRTGKSIAIEFKRNDNLEDVADLTIDGTNWWSTRCIYYVTGYVSQGSISFNGERREVVNTIFFHEQMGFPFSLTRLVN